MSRFLLPVRLSLPVLVFSCLAALRLPAAPAASEPLQLTAKNAGAENVLELAKAFPLPGAREVCPDAPLRLSFSNPVSLGATGKIRLRESDGDALVDEIDVALPTAKKRIGGAGPFVYSPVTIEGVEVHLQFRNGILAYGKSYYVTVDEGVFRDALGAYAAVDKQSGWSFTVKKNPPPAQAPRLTVAADGSGDFCTLQGALDFIPDGNTAPKTLFVRKGVYREIVFFAEKHNLTILGESRKETVQAYANNAKLNASGNPYGGAKPNPSAVPKHDEAVYKRGLFLAHRCEGLTLANMTFRNTTPQGGSQAEAVILNGTTSARAILKDLDLFSYQDTLQINGQAYVAGCHIEGDVDFLWGTGPCFFENSEFVTLRSGAFFTQIRNPATNHGYVFLHCRFVGASGVTGNYLSRIEPHRFPASEVVLLECTLGSAVRPEGWQLQLKQDQPQPQLKDLHFWEFHSRAENGELVDSSQRHAASRRLVMPEDKELINSYKDSTWVLGNGWKPRAEPIFIAREKAAGK